MIDLRRFTPARVSLSRTGHSLPTAELLRFDLDHARARDAVHQPLELSAITHAHLLVHSAAHDRREFLRRPDLGRQLAPGTVLPRGDHDLAIVIADGLSASAVARHAIPLLDALLPLVAGWKLAPVVVALQARVALGDAVGKALGARMVAVLIGERPGLSSPDSLGIYLTWNPRPGRSDAERNCISNIRSEGMAYDLAARKLHFLMTEARMRKLSGVELKDTFPALLG